MSGNESSSSADGSSKREREKEDDGTGMFKKPKKISKSSPLRAHREGEDKLDRLLQMMEGMKIEMAEMRREQKEYVQLIKEIKEENQILKRECEKNKMENEEAKREIKDLRKTISYLEREKKEKNLVMYGWHMEVQDPGQLAVSVRNFIEQSLALEVQVKAAHKLGERTCLVELQNRQDKENIMKNKHKLRYLEGNKVFLGNDLTVEERMMQQQIRIRAREERKGGKTVRVGFSRLIINGEEWKWNRNTNKLEKKN